MLAESMKVTSGLAGLLGPASRLSGAGLHRVREMAGQLLALPAGAASLGAKGELERGGSALNAGGSPLQLSLSATRSELRAHLVADPGLDAGRAAAVRLFAQEAGPLSGLLHRSLELHPPLLSPLWLAAGLGPPAAAVYFLADRHDRKGSWDRASRWLAAVLPSPGESLALVDRLRDRAELAFVCLEGSNSADARAKLYWRLAAPCPLADLGLEILRHPAFAQFLSACLDGRSIRLAGMVLSAGFRVATGALFDAKADLCAHCLDLADGDWIELTGRCSRQHGVRAIPVSGLLGGGLRMAGLGLGLDCAGRRRLNLYLSPVDPLDAKETP